MISVGHARQDHTHSAPPRGLNLEETLRVLRETPHERHSYPAGTLEEFERLMREIDAAQKDGPNPEIRDASQNHDKYIYE